MTTDNPYEQYDPENLVLRDHLAIDRTVLALERTFLAYVRTSLTLIVAGVSFIYIFDSIVPVIIGMIFVPSGLGVAALGVKRYLDMQRLIRMARKGCNDKKSIK